MGLWACGIPGLVFGVKSAHRVMPFLTTCHPPPSFPCAQVFALPHLQRLECVAGPRAEKVREGRAFQVGGWEGPAQGGLGSGPRSRVR